MGVIIVTSHAERCSQRDTSFHVKCIVTLCLVSANLPYVYICNSQDTVNQTPLVGKPAKPGFEPDAFTHTATHTPTNEFKRMPYAYFLLLVKTD